MKILLIGEYSNVHWTLGAGLRKLGHEVTVASEGDYWKAFKRDLDLQQRNFFLKAYTSVNYRLSGYRLLAEDAVKILTHQIGRKYDVVQIINPVFLRDTPAHLKKVFNTLKRWNGKIFLGAYGDDYFFAKAALDGFLRYSIFDPYLKNEQYRSDPAYAHPLKYLRESFKELNEFVAEKADGIIAPVIEYKIPYDRFFAAKTKLIPFPIDLETIPYKENTVQNNTVRFFHGVQANREVVKGSGYIRETMELAKKKFGDRIEYHQGSNIPFQHYLDFLLNFNVLIDQIYGYSQGMNTLQAMATGRICAGGNETEFRNAMGIDEAPVFNITSDPLYNLSQIESIMEKVHLIPEIGKKSRQHVEQHHNFISIAQQYVDFWSSK